MNSHKKRWIVALKQIGITQASRRLYGLIPRNKNKLKIGTGLSAGIFSFDSPHDRVRKNPLINSLKHIIFCFAQPKDLN